MKRRDFVDQIITIGGMALVGIPQIACTTPSKYKMGLQLFTVRDVMAKDPIQTLKKVKALGYEDFETYGFNPETEKIYGFTVSEFKQVLDDLNLTTTSGHYGFSDYFHATEAELNRFVDQCIHASNILDAPYITWPWVHPERRNAESFKRLADKLNHIGEQVRAAGLNFAYHNHGYEFQNWEGTTGHDILMRLTDSDLVKLQMDMYWVVNSGKTPKELVDQQPGRYTMWHIKDMDKITRDYSELGNGSIDYAKLLPDPLKSGLEFYYIEQGGNFAVNSIKSVATSARYFKKNLQHLI
ncbi:MAG: TIM barrel protein [Flavobacteriaceae bacterium]